MLNRTSYGATALLALTFIASYTMAATIYVDDDAPGDPGPGNPDVSDPAEDGSLFRPFDAIQKAINVAGNGDTVLVLAGVYAGNGNRDIDTLGLAITIDGGTAATTIIDCEAHALDPHRGFDVTAGPFILKNLTIRNGYADFGGGVSAGQLLGLSPFSIVVEGIVFESNTADSGGGLFLQGSLFSADTVLIDNCSFVANAALTDGGALTIFGVDTDVTITDCSLTDNQAAALGGGLYADGGTLSIVNSNFVENTATSQGGGAAGNAAFVTLDTCVFDSNTSLAGGGLHMSSSATGSVVGCSFNSNVALGDGGGATLLGEATFIDCDFSDNVAQGPSIGGGGVSLFSSSAVVSFDDCTFARNNTAAGGGGLYWRDGGELNLTNCNFAENSATSRGGGVDSSGAVANLDTCTFDSNTAQDGGGLSVASSATAFVDDSTFNANVALDDGGAVQVSGIDGEPNGPTLRASNCAFTNNFSAEDGGAIDAIFPGDVHIATSLLLDNEAGDDGGAVRSTGGADVELDRCRIVGNTCADVGGGIYVVNEASAEITNSVITSNIAGTGGGVGVLQGSGKSEALVTAINSTMVANGALIGSEVSAGAATQVTLANSIVRNAGATPIEGSGVVVVTYSNVEGGWPGDGNIDALPLFVDPLGPDSISGTGDEDLALSAGSPCIDAGDNTAVPIELTYDLNGDPRFVDDPNTTDTGNGIPPLVDMGAFEFGASCPEDLDGNGAVGFADLTILLADWGPCVDCASDLDKNGVVGFADLTALLAAWGPCS